MRGLFLALLVSAGCANEGRGGGGGGDDGGRPPITVDDGGTTGGDGGQAGCGGQQNCFTVYAHGDHVLYHIDLQKKALVTVGPFKAPKVNNSEDIITDLAVSPADVIYAISNTNLYTASATDGHVTLVGPVTACGQQAVALTFTPDGKLYTADFMGAFCRINLSTSPPSVTTVGTIGSGLAVSGDLVAVADGTVYGTAYKLSDKPGMGTQMENLLVKIDPATGQSTVTLGNTKYPKLFGAAFANGQVFGFTHDGSGDVITINPITGVGTLFNSFKDPATGNLISFAGAGVNAEVPGIIN